MLRKREQKKAEIRTAATPFRTKYSILFGSFTYLDAERTRNANVSTQNITSDKTCVNASNAKPTLNGQFRRYSPKALLQMPKSTSGAIINTIASPIAERVKTSVARYVEPA